MSDENFGEEPIHQLAMPFTVCMSNGGPYDDEAFVAGYIAATVDQQLERNAPVDGYVPAPLVSQIDLVAMRHGYAITTTPWDEHPEHVLVTYRPVTAAVTS